MGVKYRVSQEHDDRIQYYGHFTGHSAEEALMKAYNKRKDTMIFNLDKSFDVKYGSNEFSIFFPKEG